MIAKLKGTIDTIANDYIIIDVSGVGYKVFTTQRIIRNLQIDEAAVVFVETLTRQDQTQLFGFADASDQEWFLRLINIPGVGAKVALAILSALTYNEFVDAISMQDKAMICQADGVGPKLASRIITELKDKLPAISIRPSKVALSDGKSQQSIQDAHAALVTLGYQRGQVTQILQKLVDESEIILPTDELIRKGLSKLSSIKTVGGYAN